MTDKAYIVANEQQEREVLETFEREGYLWSNGEKPTEWSPSDASKIGKATFPYVLINKGDVRWSSLNEFYNDATVIYDGRKEEKISEKYVVSQEFMNELEEWKLNKVIGIFINTDDITMIPNIIFRWWRYDHVSSEECNNRLIAIIRWVNGEDVFEVDKPKKWVVRSKDTDDGGDKHYWKLFNLRGVLEVTSTFELRLATKFETKEEAESWVNSHQEVIEVEE